MRDLFASDGAARFDATSVQALDLLYDFSRQRVTRETLDLLQSLAKIGYDGPIAAEPFRPDLRNLPRDEAMEKVSAAMKKAFALVDAEGA